MPTNTTTGRVRVRMYRQGLGDCFLLRFPRANGQPFHLVIDSGVIMGTSEPGIRMSEVAEDIKRETGGKIDALVVTHEHWDHVSGFKQAREVWRQMDIAEVWLAWTEDPKHPLAKKLRQERAAKLTSIKNKIAALAGGAAFRLDAERGGRIDSLLGFLGLSLATTDDDQGGTKEALDYIAERGKKRTYYKPGTSFEIPDVAGLRVFVLGPPENEKKIKKSDPSSAHPEVYSDPGHAFAFAGQGGSVEVDEDRPFAGGQGVPMNNTTDYDRAFNQFFPTLRAHNPAWRRLGTDGLGEIERLALALDGDTNNTSLALAFELADGRVLLFPADAQVGNWLSWQDYTWKVKSKSIRADDLLARTVLYKVGHHGSHNATLKDDGLEKMTHRDLLALVPVNKAMAVKKRWKMPFPPLYERLKEKTRGRVVLADASERLPKAPQLPALTGTERKQFKQTVTATDLFIDVVL